MSAHFTEPEPSSEYARLLAECAAREPDGTEAITGLTGHQYVVLAVSRRHNPERFAQLRALHSEWYPT